jgi:phage/plasmid-associated DNA primase
MLRGMTLNIVSELGDEKLVTGSIFKAIVSFEEVTARLPYQEPIKFRSTAWHVFASNTVPRTNDRDAAFERRILAIRLEKSLRPNEIDPGYLVKVEGELAGVVTWAVEGALRAMRRGHFECPPGHSEILAEMQHGDDCFARFAIGQIEKAPDTDPGVSTKVIHAAVRKFAELEGKVTEGWKPVTGARRMAELLRTLYGATQYQVSGVPHYRGVRLKKGPSPNDDRKMD